MKLIPTTLLLGLLLASGHALAHAEHDHAEKITPVIKEQKDWGIAGEAKDVKRSIEVKMLDSMRFEPAKISVKLGETLKFVLRNSGAMMHEFVIGTKKENDAHAALMLQFPNMEHDEPYMAHVGPGKQSEIIWTFNRAGEFDFSCLIAGHYQAGMVGKISVAATAQLNDMSEGEIRKIDKENRKLTLKHGEIKNLDMPAMTMVFQIRDPALLNRVRNGDKVKFTAEQVGGSYFVIDLQQNK